MKLIGQLKMVGYTSEIESNVYRWQRDPSAQEIGLLALFLLGNGDTIVKILSDRDFQIILSFRSIQEMFSAYRGDSAELYRRLLSGADDQYIRRACIHGIGDGKLEGFGNFLMDGLDAPMNVLLETIRTIGKLKYDAAREPIYIRCSATRHGKCGAPRSTLYMRWTETLALMM